MKILHNVSAQKISWVKSNRQLEDVHGISNLYFPENIDDIQELLNQFISSGSQYDVIGYSSNVLFLPSYRMENVICTKYMNRWVESETEIVCDCGVSVSKLARYAVEQGYVGFEGLTDLPGTVAAAVYGNSGCRGCSVNSLVKSFTLIDDKGEIKCFSVDDLNLKYRSTSLKRGELHGTIISVTLKKVQGDPVKLKQLSLKNHQIRKSQQPSGVNNLGTTINEGPSLTTKGVFLYRLERIIQLLIGSKDRRKSFPIVLKIIGLKKYAPYVYIPNRYIFLDQKSHKYFDGYFEFIKTLYNDARLEIEIRK